MKEKERERERARSTVDEQQITPLIVVTKEKPKGHGQGEATEDKPKAPGHSQGEADNLATPNSPAFLAYSFLLPWGHDKQLDNIIRNELHLEPPDLCITFGLSGYVNSHFSPKSI